YVHERGNYDNIRAATRERVLSRGDNHQTIHSNTKGPNEIMEIMEGFMSRFQPVDPESHPDDGFDTIIDMDPCASSRENLEVVVDRMYAEYPKLFAGQPKPTADDMDAAIHAALNDYAVDIKHEIKGRNDGRPQSNGSHAGGQSNGKQKERKVDYFAVHLPPARITAVLDASFRDVPRELARMYTVLKHQRRVQPAFH
ncbi:tRNA ligase, partial [Teratosphaeriaceae sp. CCFEE 6253]